MSNDNVELDAVFDEDFTNELTRLMEDWRVSGISICLTREDRGSHQELVRCFGKRDAVNAVTPNTRFAISSNTKLMAVLVLGKALQDKGLDYDCRVKDILPDFDLTDKHAANQCLLSDLFSHRSGLSNVGDLLYTPDFDELPILDRLKNLRPVVPFRSTLQYCSVMFDLIPLLVETLTGTDYSEYMKQYLTGIGMTDTNFDLGGEMAFGFEPLRTVHGLDPDQTLELPFSLQNSGEGGKGSIRMLTSGHDLVKWLKYYPTDTSYKAAISPRVDTTDLRGHPPHDLEPTTTYSLAHKTCHVRGHVLHFHYGSCAGFRSFVGHFPELQLAIGMMTNSSQGQDLYQWVIGYILERLGGTKMQGLASEWKAILTKSKSNRIAGEVAGLAALPGTGDETISGTYSAPGLTTWTITTSDNLPERPECIALPWLASLYGQIQPTFTSMGNGKFECCRAWTQAGTQSVRYGSPFQAELSEDKEEMTVYGLTGVSAGLKEKDHPIVFYRQLTPGAAP